MEGCLVCVNRIIRQTLRLVKIMKTCKVCQSFAFNLNSKEGIDQGDLCDTHYWKDRCEKIGDEMRSATLIEAAIVAARLAESASPLYGGDILNELSSTLIGMAVRP